MEDLRRFLSKFSALAGRLLLMVAGKDNRPGDPGVKTGGDTMARFDRDGLAAAGTGPVQASGEAYYELGMMYASGRSVLADFVVAHKWLNVAVARGFGPAIARRAEVAQEMSAAEIAAAQREARLWLARQ